MRARWWRRIVVTGVLLGGIGLLGAPAAQAHPLGNATVNHYDGLELFADHVADTAVVDTAEIPTLQRASLIDTDGNGQISPVEATAYAGSQCAALAAAVTITVNDGRLPLTVATSTYEQLSGAAGLQVGRLQCGLTAPANLSRPATVTVDDPFDSAGIGGWHEITAVGNGVTLQNSPVPAASISDQLRKYPNDLLSSPLDVRSASISTAPGAGTSTYAAVAGVPGADVVIRALNDFSNAFNALVGAKQMSIGVGLLAVLLSVLLGAGHAFLPGHGKTIMAAYLVGKRGRLRDVITVGATVTITHTVGVLVLGLLLSASAALAPTAVEQWLAVLSGLIVAGVGVGLFVSALRRRRAGEDHMAALLVVPEPALAGGGGDLSAPAPETGHGRHGHGHAHGHGHGHNHGFGRGGLIGLGVAGGLVPSPSALLVLLGAIALGRTWLGVVLVLGYGVGMALALSLAGILLVRLQGRVATIMAGRRVTRLAAVAAYLPVLTACLVIVVGVGLVLRALSGSV